MRTPIGFHIKVTKGIYLGLCDRDHEVWPCLVERLGGGLHWALTYTNARVAEESPVSNNPLHKQALDDAIAALAAWEQGRNR